MIKCKNCDGSINKINYRKIDNPHCSEYGNYQVSVRNYDKDGYYQATRSYNFIETLENIEKIINNITDKIIYQD